MRHYEDSPALGLANQAPPKFDSYIHIKLKHTSLPASPALRDARWTTGEVAAARDLGGGWQGENGRHGQGQEPTRDQRQETIGEGEGFRAGNVGGGGIQRDGEPITRECVGLRES